MPELEDGFKLFYNEGQKENSRGTVLLCATQDDIKRAVGLLLSKM